MCTTASQSWHAGRQLLGAVSHVINGKTTTTGTPHQEIQELSFYSVLKSKMLREETTLPVAIVPTLSGFRYEESDNQNIFPMPGYFQNTEIWVLVCHQAGAAQCSLAPSLMVWNLIFITLLFYLCLPLSKLSRYQVPVSLSVSKCSFVY